MKNLVEEEKIEDTIKEISKVSFTVLDFIEVFKTLHPEDWHRLVERFGTFGEKRRYTTTTYLSNRLDIYSQKPGSLLIPFVRYKQGKFRDYRRTTNEEKKFFGSPWIAVFKKKKMLEIES
nr:hypothetical protein [Candidatus Njordarchaeota archaeon]